MVYVIKTRKVVGVRCHFCEGSIRESGAASISNTIFWLFSSNIGARYIGAPTAYLACVRDAKVHHPQLPGTPLNGPTISLVIQPP
jgi:hypothetical protein